ncbi:hypothetical protein ABZX92_26705 [Lentzea sp. NPDC006480]|uniref:hypothetical protein n=1 Tax=Lentzea sp. NPDC006480 TaxID=3157176 RepID=UPI0033B848B1
MSASLLRSADGLVGIEYGHFYVESFGLTEPPLPAFEDNSVLSVVDDAFAVCVPALFPRHVLVRIESWDGDPGGEATDDRVVHFSDVSIAARAVMATEPETRTLELPAPGTYRVRVHRLDTEHVVLRLWPTAEPAHPREAAPTEPGEQRRALGDWLTSR